MAIKVPDRIVSWYIKNVLIPKTEIIDKPGFIASQFTDKGKRVYIRELGIPEDVIAYLENAVVEEYGDLGKQKLYSAGKKAGYNYASLSLFPVCRGVTDKQYITFSNEVIKFVETLYASEIKNKMDLSKRRIDFEMKDYIVCRKNGHGYIMTSGGMAGIWAWGMGDTKIEGIQTVCQGLGAEACKVICAPVDILQKYSKNILVEPKIERLKSIMDYNRINRIRNTNYGKLSLQSLIDSGFFAYEHGSITYGTERYFVDEAHLIYYLDVELSKLPKGREIMFRVAFDYAKKLVEYLKSTSGAGQQFITDYLAALGWGDVLVKKTGDQHKIIISFFPWTDLYKTGQDFHLFRGLLSGLISGNEGRDIKLKLVDSRLIGDNLCLVFSS
jgi:hypothetical protein